MSTSPLRTVEPTSPFRSSKEKYSAQHQSHIALMADYFMNVRRQEQLYVDAGLPAEGLTDFLAKWFNAWEMRSVPHILGCMTSDCAFADQTTGGSECEATLLWANLYASGYRLIRDGVFYPQDNTSKSLPLFDFLDGRVRITVPWRMVGTWRFTRGRLNVVGVDRYNMVRQDGEWRIARIDTDGDNLIGMLSLSPVRIPMPNQRFVERLYRVARTLRITRDLPESSYRDVLGDRFDEIKRAL